MEKFKNYRFLCFLLAGGLVFSSVTGYPLKAWESNFEEGESISENSISENEISVSDNQISENDLAKNAVSDNTISGNTVSENTVEEPLLPLEFTDVEDDYFSDAVFIGDSRVVSLYMYAGWEDATFYCSSGMTMGSVFKNPTGKWKDGNWKVNIAEALQQQQFKKVYIMLGINDMGVGNLDYFVEHYTDMISQIRGWQPDAIIYVMSILNVSAARNAQGDYINNHAIDVRNEKLRELDNGQDIFYLDINSVLCDANGCLTAKYTFDGVHIYAKYVPIWTDYLKSHAIIK